jgi:hypothetical protein
MKLTTGQGRTPRARLMSDEKTVYFEAHIDMEDILLSEGGTGVRKNRMPAER